MLSRQGAIASLAVLALLLAPAVVTATPGDGRLEMLAPTSLVGDVVVHAPALSLHQTAPATTTAITSEPGALRILEITFTNKHVGPTNSRHSEFTKTTHLFSAATLEVVDPDDDFALLLATETGPVQTFTTTDAILRGLAAKSLVISPGLEGDSLPPGSIADRPEYFGYGIHHEVETAAEHGSATLSGHVLGYLEGATLRIADGGTITTLDARATTVETIPGALSETTVTFLLFEYDTPALALDTRDAIRAYAAAPNVGIRGGVVTERADGELLVDDTKYPVREEPVALEGDLTLKPRIPAPTAPQSEATAPATTDRPAESYQMDVVGDIHAISVAAERVPFTPAASETVVYAVTGTALLASAALYFWPLVRYEALALAVPLYHRLKKPEILDNEVRNRVYGLVKESPGISLRAIHRASDLSWGTVVYHLRQLERHHLVKSTRHGRNRNYYENHGKYAGIEREIAVLNSDKTTAVARAIAGTPGVTQEAIMATLAYPQSTVSYHIQRLKAAELVEERRVGKYATYFPGAHLAELLLIVGASEAGSPPSASTAAPAEASLLN